MSKRKRLILSLTDEKQRWLEEMRAEDYENEEPLASYIVRLITKEKKRRDEEKVKRGPGRPKKEDGQEVMEDDDNVMVPHPIQIYADRGIKVTKGEAEAIRLEKGL